MAYRTYEEIRESLSHVEYVDARVDAEPADSTLLELLDYWRDKRADRPFPAWSDIDLMEIYKIAPFCLVVDVIGDFADFSVRFQGTNVTKAFNYDGTSGKFSDFVKPDLLSQIALTYKQAVKWQGPICVTGSLGFWRGRSHISFEGVILPLGDSGVSADQLLIGHHYSI